MFPVWSTLKVRDQVAKSWDIQLRDRGYAAIAFSNSIKIRYTCIKIGACEKNQILLRVSHSEKLFRIVHFFVVDRIHPQKLFAILFCDKNRLRCSWNYKFLSLTKSSHIKNIICFVTQMSDLRNSSITSDGQRKSISEAVIGMSYLFF